MPRSRAVDGYMLCRQIRVRRCRHTLTRPGSPHFRTKCLADPGLGCFLAALSLRVNMGGLTYSQADKAKMSGPHHRKEEKLL